MLPGYSTVAGGVRGRGSLLAGRAVGGGTAVWRTSLGDRVLRGAEWELFRTALAVVWELVEESSDAGDVFPLGIDAFNDLQPGQQLALLALVGQALHDEDTPAPPLT